MTGGLAAGAQSPQILASLPWALVFLQERKMAQERGGVWGGPISLRSTHFSLEISSHHPTSPLVLQDAPLSRQLGSRAKVRLFGGPHSSSLPENCSALPTSCSGCPSLTQILRRWGAHHLILACLVHNLNTGPPWGPLPPGLL